MLLLVCKCLTTMYLLRTLYASQPASLSDYTAAGLGIRPYKKEGHLCEAWVLLTLLRQASCNGTVTSLSTIYQPPLHNDMNGILFLNPVTNPLALLCPKRKSMLPNYLQMYLSSNIHIAVDVYI